MQRGLEARTPCADTMHLANRYLLQKPQGEGRLLTPRESHLGTHKGGKYAQGSCNPEGRVGWRKHELRAFAQAVRSVGHRLGA